MKKLNKKQLEEWYDNLVCDLSSEDISIIDMLLEYFENALGTSKKIAELKSRIGVLNTENSRLLTDKNYAIEKYNILAEDMGGRMEIEAPSGYLKEMIFTFKNMIKQQINFFNPKRISKGRVKRIVEGFSISAFWLVVVSVIAGITWLIFQNISTIKILASIYSAFFIVVTLISITIER